MTSAADVGESETLITGDELARTADHELCELVDGRIVPMSPTNPEHGRIELKIGAALYQVASTQNLGMLECSRRNVVCDPGHFSVGSRPSAGAPVPDEPRNSFRPSGRVRSLPLPLSEPSLAR